MWILGYFQKVQVMQVEQEMVHSFHWWYLVLAGGDTNEIKQ